MHGEHSVQCQHHDITHRIHFSYRCSKPELLRPMRRLSQSAILHYQKVVTFYLELVLQLALKGKRDHFYCNFTELLVQPHKQINVRTQRHCGNAEIIEEIPMDFRI